MMYKHHVTRFLQDVIRLSLRMSLFLLMFNSASLAFCEKGHEQNAIREEASKTNTTSDSRKKLLERFVKEFVKITPGKQPFPQTFNLGSTNSRNSQPIRKVTFNYTFYINKYEVPQNLYELIMGENPSRWKGPRNSAEMMTRSDAITFCQKITKELQEHKLIERNQEVRLPSEAEWEYCCRAGTQTAYSFGEKARSEADTKPKQATVLDQYAWHTGNAAGNDPPVGALKPNPWGLYDMHGYLWEMVSDDWHDTYEQSPLDGSSWREKETSKEMPIRGGSWKDSYNSLQSHFRIKVEKKAVSDALGFRCVWAKVKAKQMIQPKANGQ